MKENNPTHTDAIEIMFLGGVGEDVTGSSTLISFMVGEERHYILVDAGGFQGKDNRDRFFPVNAEKIDAVIITHAHYDHIGLLPLLYKNGFRGQVYLTEQAMKQGIAILEDAASIQKMEFEGTHYKKEFIEKQKRKLENKKNKQLSYKDIKHIDHSISQFDEILESVLYSIEDVRGLKQCFFPVKPGNTVKLYQGLLSFYFMVNPHQNGAVEVKLFYGEGDDKNCIFFSGDVGSHNSLLYKERDCLQYDTQVDFCVMESLHGTSNPIETIEESVQKLEHIVEEGMKEGRRIVLVGFSLDRNAMLVFLLNQMLSKGKKFDAYFDSPLGLSELILYQNFYAMEHRDFQQMSKDKWFKDLGDMPFDLKRFKRVIIKVNDHTELLNTSGPQVIITASANGTGGRVVDYFDKFIQDEKTTFVFCGWIFPGSPSSVLTLAKEGEIVDLGGRRFIKHCKTERLYGLSSHGYYEDLLNILATFPNKKAVILNHGEMKEKEDIRDMIESKKYSTQIPILYDAYHLSKAGLQKLTNEEIHEFFGEALYEDSMRNVILEIERSKEAE